MSLHEETLRHLVTAGNKAPLSVLPEPDAAIERCLNYVELMRSVYVALIRNNGSLGLYIRVSVEMNSQSELN